MVMTDSVSESVLVRLQTFPITIKALQKMTVTKSVPESVFGKASGLYQMALMSLWRSLWQNLFLV